MISRTRQKVNQMNIIMIGDVSGRPGRRILADHLAEIKEEYHASFVVANLENASGGNGINEKNLKHMLTLPIDAVTMGNHVWGQRDTLGFIDNYPMMVRPLNFRPGVPGKGYAYFDCEGLKICVLNLSGQAFMKNMDSPFLFLDDALEEIQEKADVLLVDFHAETTSEKLAMGFYLDGLASAIVGTHTHVQTADNRVLPGGTAYITDLGMTGSLNSILGVKREIIIEQMLTGLPARYEIELEKPWQLNGVVIDIDEQTGMARSIDRIYRIYED